MSRFSDPSQITTVLDKCRAATASIKGDIDRAAAARVALRRCGPEEVLALVGASCALLRSEGHRREARRLAEQSVGDGSSPGADARKSDAEDQQAKDSATQNISNQSLSYMQGVNPNPEFHDRTDTDNAAQSHDKDLSASQATGTSPLAKDTPAISGQSFSMPNERQSQLDFATLASSTIKDVVNPNSSENRDPSGKTRGAEPSLESVSKLTDLASKAADGAKLFMNLAHDAKVFSKGPPRAMGFIGTALTASVAYDESDGPVGFGWEMTKSVAAGYAGDAAGVGTATGLIVIGMNPLGAAVVGTAIGLGASEVVSRGFGGAAEMVKSAIGSAPYLPQYLEQEIEKLYRQQSF
jgi:hypothetical protein